MPLRSKSTGTETLYPPDSSSKTLGLIAGEGNLPMVVASEAKKMDYRVLAIALQPPADGSLKPFADNFYKVHIGRFGEILRLLKKFSAEQAVIVGKVSKRLLYSNKKSIMPDLRAIKLLFSLKDRTDDTFMQAISNVLKENGIKLLKTTSFTKKLLTPEGILTRKHPKKSQWKDIEFGWKIAKETGRLDIGQTIVVKGTAVMAVEAIEGTDEAIMRGGSLAEHGAVIIKVSKPQQDMRLDVPVVGIDTLSVMKKVNAKVLALEAGKSIIVDKESFIKEADKAEL
ncbi:MAG: UDP-2,3-diacylglucosamine diphosphatase LpxI [Candidatus Mariimomonas ferrooxydans]